MYYLRFYTFDSLHTLKDTFYLLAYMYVMESIEKIQQCNLKLDDGDDRKITL